MKQVDARGGVKACLEDDEALKGLVGIYQSSQPSATVSSGSRRDPFGASSQSDDAQLTFPKLKEELKEDVERSLERNSVVFERKLEVQKRQIVLELQLVVQREGDRVISAITSGPHDRIIDPVSNLMSKLVRFNYLVDIIRTCMLSGWKWYVLVDYRCRHADIRNRAGKVQ